MYKSWSNREIKYLKNNYFNLGAIKISRNLSRSYDSVRYMARKYNLYSSKNTVKFKKYKCNEFAFSTPQSLKVCYWAGFIAADGCVLHPKDKSKQLRIALSNKDLKHLIKLKQFLKADYPILNVGFRQWSKYPQSLLSISSNKIVEDLYNNFNIIPNKSLTLKFPKKLTKKQALAFIVGYIDGDGSIGIYNTYKKSKVSTKVWKGSTLHLTILGTKSFLKEINKIFYNMKNSNISTLNQHLTRRKNIYALHITGKKALTILKTLNKVKVPKLNRKWNLLEEINDGK